MNDFFKNYKNRINELKRLDINEENTKSNLIELLLEFLGWNIHDFMEVEKEKQVISKNFVDYALKIDGISKLYIEAKKINDNLTDIRNISKAISYTNDDGIEWCLMTNGDILNLYKTREQGDLNNKLVLDIKISTDSNIEYLEYFKKENIENDILEIGINDFLITNKVSQALDKIHKNLDDGFLTQIQIYVPNLTKDQIKKGLENIEYSFSNKCKPNKIVKPKSFVSYWLTPIKSDADDSETIEEALHRLLVKYKVYAYGDRTPGRKTIKPRDKICFYATGKGVMADATVTSFPEKRMQEGIKDIQKYPWIFDLKDSCLYLENPIIINAEIRTRLGAFKDKDPYESNWAWFVQGTKKISEHDFEILTKHK